MRKWFVNTIKRIGNFFTSIYRKYILTPIIAYRKLKKIKKLISEFEENFNVNHEVILRVMANDKIDFDKKERLMLEDLIKSAKLYNDVGNKSLSYDVDIVNKHNEGINTIFKNGKTLKNIIDEENEGAKEDLEYQQKKLEILSKFLNLKK